MTLAQLGYQRGNHTTWWGFSSTTPDCSVLNSPQFLGTSGNRILCQITGWCVDISPYSEYAEDERLVMAGTSFTFAGALDAGYGLWHVQLEEDPNAGSIFDLPIPANRVCEDEVEIVRKQEKIKLLRLSAFTVFTYLAILLVGFGLGYWLFFQDDHPWSHVAWTKMPDLPVGVWGTTAVEFQDQIFVIGGTDNSRLATNTIQVYNGGSKKWQQQQQFPIATIFGAAVTYNRALYYTGGETANQKSTQHMFTWDGHHWTPSRNMSHPRSEHAAVSFECSKCESKLFVLGGHPHPSATCDGFESKRVEAFNGKSWAPEEPMQVGRCLFSAVVSHNRNRLYAIGGDKTGSHVESFDGQVWRNENPMISQNTGYLRSTRSTRAAIFGNEIFVVGRIHIEVDTQSAIDIIEIGTLDKDGLVHWSLLGETGTFFKKSKSVMAGCIFRGKYWMIGGVEEGTTAASNQTWMFKVPRRWGRAISV